MRGLLAFLCFTLMPLFSAAQSQSQLNIMPMPASFQLGSGKLVIGQSFSVALTGYKEERLDHAVNNFVRDLSRQTGMPLNAKSGDAPSATLVIHTDHASNPVQELGEDESYILNVTAANAQLTAPTPLGILHGLQTFLQLVDLTPDGFAVPAVNIQDKPRFPWRGLMIDVSRHFIPLDVIKRNLDGMAAAKLNVLHWHLSDNQGFRVESRKFPKLQEMGSDGFYYTQDEVRDLIAYAHERGIRVVPEFDIPGHSTAWLVGYPELASAPGPYEIERKWGVFNPAMDPTQEKTYKFLDEFIAEMARLFPDRYFHIGGDEVNGKQWNANPQIQQFMSQHGLKNNQELQAYFNRRVQQLVSKHGKVMMGWDEILDPNLPKNIVIQSWRGQKSLAEAARQGYSGLLSHGYYIDLNWPASRHYAVDPMADAAAALGPEEKQRILGGEACMWAEYVSPENIDSRIWPRTGAIAERLWSPPEVTDVNSMYLRLERFSRKLDWLGLTHNSSYSAMLRRLAGQDDIAALRVLADVVEPVKNYSREKTAVVEPTSATPLNRLIDAARPESDTARQFANLVDALLSGQSNSAESKAQIRTLLTRWRDNQANLEPLLEKSFLLKEVEPVSQNLSALSAAGLRALDYLDSGQLAPQAWKTEQLALIEQAKKPSAQLLLMIAPSVQKLIEASSGQPVSATALEPDDSD
ncbi:MAG TPA: family 20 glycosylhydrolase [Terriglobales bacterium]|nr:family 20 glycosylhydrolase [Terriglobales bacterium]